MDELKGLASPPQLHLLLVALRLSRCPQRSTREVGVARARFASFGERCHGL